MVESVNKRGSSPKKRSEEDIRARQKAFERAANRLAKRIQQLRVDFQRFFAGDLDLPPLELRERITAELKRLRHDNRKGLAENFRLNTLEAQLNSYLELFGRRMRQLEQGDRRNVSATPRTPKLDPDKGIVIGTGTPRPQVEALYQGLFLRDGNRNPKMDLERFRTYIHRQAEAIRTKTGCSEIVFRVAGEQGKLKLKAKPLRDPKSP